MSDADTNLFDESENDSVDSVADSRAAFDRREAAARVLAIITVGATVKQSGQRAFVLAHALKLGTCRTQRELAAKLRVTPGRVSQILKAVVRDLGL